ncbi:MAG: adenylate/guanylate cyclase domain-containing protein, partial [Gammaproteobacteria bacterium]|nr:adenylate/guanylate cyclase domain-containing protein [Gammaproteobacteria bacterium]
MQWLTGYTKHWVRIALSLLVLLAFLAHVAGWVTLGPLRHLENLSYDYRLRMTAPRDVDPRVVVIDIDEKSLAAEGRWPWSRNRLADLVDQLFDTYDISVLGFDVVFAEADTSSGLDVLERLAQGELKHNADFLSELDGVRRDLQYDRRFAESLRDRKVVLGYFFEEKVGDGAQRLVGKLPAPSFPAGKFTGRAIDFFDAAGVTANLGELQDAAFDAGFFSIGSLHGADDLIRKVPMLWQYDGAYYESLSLAMVRAYLGVSELQPGFPPGEESSAAYGALEWLWVGDRKVPVDQSVQALIPYRGPQGSFEYISATDVLTGKVSADALKGKIALVGSSAGGLLDLRATPWSPAYPGVEIHANLIAGVLDGALKENPHYTLGGEFVLLILCGLLMTLLMPLLSPLWALLTTLTLLCGVTAVNLWIWTSLNLVFGLASGLMLIVAIFVVNVVYGYFIEARGRRQLAGRFGQYIPMTLVEEMSDNPSVYSMEGESREMTVLFTDVRGFTTISEGLEPKELTELMNSFLTPMTEIIHDYRGTIDKYMGDAIMCFWGAPVRDPDHARNALAAGLAMNERLHALQPEFAQRGWPEIKIGVGINTGEMCVGNMGSNFRMAYTVLGDAVNLASRLEGLTKGYGVQAIVSETTKQQLPDFAFRELDRVRVKGKDQPVTIYEPLGLKCDLVKNRKEELALYARALSLYRSQQWDLAELQFLNLGKLAVESSLYQLYAERIGH